MPHAASIRLVGGGHPAEGLTLTTEKGVTTLRIPGGCHAGVLRLHVAAEAFPAQSKLRVRLGQGATAMIVEEIGGRVNNEVRIMNHKQSSMHAWRHECEIVLDQDAELEFISLNAVHRRNVRMEIVQRSTLSDHARIMWRNATLGALHIDHDLQSTLTGSDAVSAIDWMFYAKGDEKYHLRARNIFSGRRGGGEITMKGVAEEKGHVQCDGMIEISHGGHQTDTYLTQDVLMLDATAKVDAIPRLEIKTNDVKASHSAAVSRVTDEDLFYFAARGIIEKEAKRMFVEGFLGDLVSHISDDHSKTEIAASLSRKYQLASAQS